MRQAGVGVRCRVLGSLLYYLRGRAPSSGEGGGGGKDTWGGAGVRGEGRRWCGEEGTHLVGVTSPSDMLGL